MFALLFFLYLKTLPVCLLPIRMPYGYTGLSYMLPAGGPQLHHQTRDAVTSMCRIVASASAGVEPALMGTGPIPAVRAALAKAGWTVDQVTTSPFPVPCPCPCSCPCPFPCPYPCPCPCPCPCHQYTIGYYRWICGNSMKLSPPSL